MADELQDSAELLFRQIHPSFVEMGEPSSAGFKPTPKDDGKLSVDRSSIFSPAQSYDLHTNAKGLQSVGTYGLTVSEFKEEAVPCHADPIPATNTEVGNPAHAVGDFNAHSSGKQKTIAKRLKQKALARGQLHP